MSLSRFITKLWNQIKNLFSSLPNELKIAVQIGIVITENIKTLVDSSTADILTAIIPGNIDNIIRDKLKQLLPVLLYELKLVESSLALTQPDAIVKAAIEAIKTLDRNIRPGVLHHLSVLIIQAASDGKLSWSDAVYLSQWYYEQKFKQPAN
ncbi:MAG: hypothetical protein JWR38_3982 [Mucilaginibacter sp.]|nr:hypothetical protein [Mucilaginibacter sp.]